MGGRTYDVNTRLKSPKSSQRPANQHDYDDKNEQPRLCSGVVVVYIKQQLETFIHCYQQTIPRFRVRTRMS